MARFCGNIGYAIQTETSPGVWEDNIVVHTYRGDVNRNVRRRESSGNLNDNINISNEISIIADEFAYENFHSIVYVEFMNAKWKVTDIEVQRPRLTLTIGGVYNG